MRTKEEMGIVILSLLERREMSQKDLAVATKKDKGTINKIVLGKAEMELETLWLISKALGASIYDIIGEPPAPTLFDAATFLEVFEKATDEGRAAAISLLKRHTRPESSQFQPKDPAKES